MDKHIGACSLKNETNVCFGIKSCGAFLLFLEPASGLILGYMATLFIANGGLAEL